MEDPSMILNALQMTCYVALLVLAYGLNTAYKETLKLRGIH